MFYTHYPFYAILIISLFYELKALLPPVLSTFLHHFLGNIYSQSIGIQANITNYQDYLLLGFPSKFYITVKTSVTEKLKWGPQCKHIARPKHTVVSPRGNTKFPKMPILLLKQNKISLGFPSGSVVKNLPANAGDTGSIPGSGRSPGEGNGNLLQYACLGNPMNSRAWWAVVPGVTQSWTHLKHECISV